MKAQLGSVTVRLLIGDITQENVDAIVNAANSQLRGGGGVDGAIHRAAGARLMEETKQKYPRGCPTGSAVLTRGGLLRAQYVIHAVGPRWRGGNEGERELLASAYRTSLQLAAEHSCHSIAFPALSCGAYGYPLPEAAEVALTAVRDFERASGLPSEIRFILFSQDILQQFAEAMQRIEDYRIE